MVPLHDLNTSNKLQLSISSVQATSGFSSIDWDSLFSTTKEISSANSLSIYISFGQIELFNLTIYYEGKILASQLNILVPNSNVTPRQKVKIIAYYTKTAMERIPGFLTNAKFLGDNVFDSSLQSALMAGKMPMVGVGTVSVLGVAVADLVSAGNVTGKKARIADGSNG